MTNIVTGASGFIGKHLMKRIDAKALRYGDIHYGHSYNADRMFFLSTYGNMAHHDNYNVMVQANVQNLLTVLHGFDGWMCYMSSSSVSLPVQTPYSRTKRAAEEILQALPIKSCIVRPYSVTGVGEQKEHLIPTLIHSCMEGKEMPFDPWPVHDFVDVEDVIDGLIKLSEEKHTGMVEFGNCRPISNQHVKELVETVCGKKANTRMIVGALRPYDNASWHCRTANSYWSPNKSLEQSIYEMVKAYREQTRKTYH